MGTDMKFLFCGFGNIMQRHFRNLKKLLPDCRTDVCASHHTSYRIFDDNLNITHIKDLRDCYDINTLFYDVEKALDFEKYDAVFVGTLPPNRIKTAIKSAKRDFNLFIEKPLSNNLDLIYNLSDIIESNKLKCAIGYQMRFNPAIQEIKEMLENNHFNNIYRIEVNHCSSIYNWSKERELKDFYALQKDKGGGVLLSQIHEIDYLTYLFGKHYPISAIYGKWLDVTSDVEDNITILSNLEKENMCIPIIINLDFISKIPKRELTIHSMDETLNFDLLPKDMSEWNSYFINEMQCFTEWIFNNKKDERLATLEDGISSLEYIMDIKDYFWKI